MTTPDTTDATVKSPNLGDRPPYPTRYRKALVQRISALGTTAHEEIFRKIKCHGIDHTQNKNGMFINLSVVSNELIDEISAFVDYCVDNDRDLEEYDKRLNECKLNNRFEELPSHCDKRENVEEETESAYETNDHIPTALLPRDQKQRLKDSQDSTPKIQPSKDGVSVGTATSSGATTQLSRQNTAAVRDGEINGESSRAADASVNDATPSLPADPDCMLRLRAIMPIDVDKALALSKKRSSTKFHNAKKRFAKKKTTANDRKIYGASENDIMNELHLEEYPIS